MAFSTAWRTLGETKAGNAEVDEHGFPLGHAYQYVGGFQVEMQKLLAVLFAMLFHEELLDGHLPVQSGMGGIF